MKKKRLIVAVGGNALQRRGDRLTITNMLKAACCADMAPAIADLASRHEIVLTHGNGPQVGELALERSAATFDVLGAESVGQIGYILAQALSSAGCKAVPIVTQVVVDPAHEAFKNPTKFVGPVYGAKEAQALAESLGWSVKADGEYFRRVVPSPPPVDILQVDAVKTLLEHSRESDVVPIACGGGGVPVARVKGEELDGLQGVECVIDKDACGAKLAVDLDADGYIILTDGGGIFQDYGKPEAKEMEVVTPEYLLGIKAGKNFPGSMGPKIEAAIRFVQESLEKGRKKTAWAAIGDLKDARDILANKAGTMIVNDVEGGVIWRQKCDATESNTKNTPPKLTQDPPKYA
eukprot:jgi/Bigna1/92845/estExt_fgenesh1_pm.C_810007